MMDIDRITLGWQPFLTPRQTRIIHAALAGAPQRPEDEEHVPGLVEWFESEVRAKEAKG